MNALHRGGRTRSVSLLLTVALLNGCYSYAPLRGDAPRPGERIRVYLEEPQDVRLTNVTANDVTLISGEAAGMNQEQLAVSAFVLTSQNGYENIGSGETALVRRDNVQAIERSQISATKTAGLVGIVVAIGALVTAAIASGSSQGNPPGPPPVTQ